jgi:hypothetical protein
MRRRAFFQVGGLRRSGRLADVNNLGCVLSDGMDAQHLQGVGVEEYLQHAGFVSDDLPFGDLLIPRHSGLVGNAGAGQFLLRPPDHRDFRDGI